MCGAGRVGSVCGRVLIREGVDAGAGCVGRGSSDAGSDDDRLYCTKKRNPHTHTHIHSTHTPSPHIHNPDIHAHATHMPTVEKSFF